MNDPIIAIGGLFRCCIESIKIRARDDMTDGTRLTCPHCSESSIKHDGVWSWDHPEV
jgi:hypothetical protein